MVLELFALTIVCCILLGFGAGVALSCYRLADNRGARAAARRVFGLTAQLGGPEGGGDGPP